MDFNFSTYHSPTSPTSNISRAEGNTAVIDPSQDNAPSTSLCSETRKAAPYEVPGRYSENVNEDDEYGVDVDFTNEMMQAAMEMENEYYGSLGQSLGSSPPLVEETCTATPGFESRSNPIQQTDWNGKVAREICREGTRTPSFEELQAAARSSNIHPFFTRHSTLDYELESESDDDADSDSESEGLEELHSNNNEGKKGWFKQPKYMPNWLYSYFNQVIRPLLTAKEKQSLVKPRCFLDNGPFSPASFWIHPPEPALLLSRRRFEPTLYYRPRIFLWLPHFQVEKLLCPNPTCRKIPLEKNGMLPPRRIFDTHNVFYIVTWGYYCRKGCRRHFTGWSQAILNSLPPYLRLAFPAILSHRAGLSHSVITQLRVGNQHKMGPSGVRALLTESYTQTFNRVQLQFIEALFEAYSGREMESHSTDQNTLHTYMPLSKVADFGQFSDPQGYAGIVPSEHILTDMLNKAIERDEHDANQHTACLAPDQIAIDDSHKVNKHIAKIDGIPIFGALWTCMDSWCIRGQALTLTKAHDERIGPLLGIAKSIQLYGHPNPQVAFSDDPIKDKILLKTAFPSLFENLSPMAKAHGLEPLELPSTTKTLVLDTPELVEGVFSSVMAPLDDDNTIFLCVHLDAEWNISRHIGVSIIQITLHSFPNEVYIIPVHKFNKLPTSLLRFLISPRIFKIGSGVKGDLTRLKKQFLQLKSQTSFNVIELKDFCIRRGIIPRQGPAPLDILLEKTAGKYLSKDESFRRSNEWEGKKLHPDFIQYAALDVYASRVIFEKAVEVSVIPSVDQTTPLGTRVVLYIQEGGEPAAYGRICLDQPSMFGRIRVKVPTKSRVLVEIDTVLIESAAAILHQLSTTGSAKTKSNALTLGQLRASSSSPTFCVVTLFSHLGFDYRTLSTAETTPNLQTACSTSKSNFNNTPDIPYLGYDGDPSDDEHEFRETDTEINVSKSLEEEDFETESDKINMLEAYCAVTGSKKGKKRQLDSESLEPLSEVGSSSSSREFDTIANLRKVMDTKSDDDENYTLVKKDIFHAFHMLPIPVNHGARPAFLRALRDHILRWDPTARAAVEKVCTEKFNLTFDQMLLRNPRFIAERTPRYVPSPRILVASIEHVYKMFQGTVDARTGAPLFTEQLKPKAEAVLELARQGYLSDVEGVSMYERAGVDRFGLQKWKCVRGTNNVEGGPHGDIYRKFGAFNAGPRLTTNCLTDHRTWYNLQAFAMHLFGVDWGYHHCLGMINRTAFLLNYLSDVIDGAKAYSHWINGDLYERTTEQFGICRFPESLRDRLSMEPYSETAAKKFKLNANDDWLRKRQGLALPALPPTTPEARQYYFTQIREYTQTATVDGKKHINHEGFAQEWNRTADGKDRFYVTCEVLMAYAKRWEKISNVRATQELMSEQIDGIKTSAEVFANGSGLFPSYITSTPSQTYPSRGVIEFNDLEALDTIPTSLATNPPLSHSISKKAFNHHLPAITATPSRHDGHPSHYADSDVNTNRPSTIPSPPPDTMTPTLMIATTSPSVSHPVMPEMPLVSSIPNLNVISREQSQASNLSIDSTVTTTGSRPTTKRRRVVPDHLRKHKTMRSCRRCQNTDCPGNNNILNCPAPCTVPCKICQRVEACRGVDNGKKCTFNSNARSSLP